MRIRQCESRQLLIGNSCRFFKNFQEHAAGELAGLRVLVRRMIGRQQRAPTRGPVFSAMLK